jgi:hypothetical protein
MDKTVVSIGNKTSINIYFTVYTNHPLCFELPLRITPPLPPHAADSFRGKSCRLALDRGLGIAKKADEYGRTGGIASNHGIS